MKKKLVVFIFISLSIALNAQVRNVIIDADTDNEIDDLLAITAALKSSKLEVIGLTAAQWDGRNNTVEEGHDPWWNDNSAYTSWLMNTILIQLLDREDIPVLMGSEKKIVYKRGGPDNKPRKSEASDFIIREALKLPGSEKLTIISTGALTNVASAIMLQPEIANKISLYWLGQTYDFDNSLWIGTKEFNVANDLDAFDVLCDAEDLEFHIMPNNVSGLLKFHNGNSIARLEDVKGIGTFIAERWKKRIGGDLNAFWIMWDVALICAITNPEWAGEKRVDTPPGTLKRKINLYTGIDEKKMENEFWNVLNNCNAAKKHSDEPSRIRKIKDVIVYEDAKYHATFPSIIKMGPKDYIAAFRRAPDRRLFGEAGNGHVDPNSYLVQVRSRDGENWTTNPELIYAHPFGGSQDPCLLKLRDGTLLCASYGWAFTDQQAIDNLKKPVLHESWHGGEVAFLGGYILRSFDQGETWEGPIYPPHLESEIYSSAMGEPLPTYNRGALCESKNGKVYWIVATHDSVPLGKTSNHLLFSDDKGETWHYSGLVASDDKASFNEASIYETPKGDLVGFLRTANMDDQACIARSTDGGKTFKWESMGFQGHPLTALRLPDNRVLLTYGYRHKPYGIRARVLNAECTDYATAEEFVLRDDGCGPDLGYPWPVLLENNRVLVVYYFNRPNGDRYIAGTILEIARSFDELYLNTTPEKKVILDVDMCTDVDDVCAVRIATAFDDDGIIDLKGIAYSIVGKNNLEALRGFLTYENKPDVLIGRSSVNIPDESPYWDLMCEYNDGHVKAYDAVKMYRKILAQSDTYVDIITTGYVTNIENLLKSEADEYSGLTGLELVKKKCGQLYIVGGTYPEGRCNNFFFAKEARTAIDYVSKNWPYPILFFTNEVGGRLTCGAQLQAVDKENKDIVTRSLVAFGTQNGRHAWDPFGVWCAGYACGEINKIGLKRVDLEIDTETGYNKFTDAVGGKHFVTYRLCDDDNYYNTMMDKLLIKKANTWKK